MCLEVCWQGNYIYISSPWIWNESWSRSTYTVHIPVEQWKKCVLHNREKIIFVGVEETGSFLLNFHFSRWKMLTTSKECWLWQITGSDYCVVLSHSHASLCQSVISIYSTNCELSVSSGAFYKSRRRRIIKSNGKSWTKFQKEKPSTTTTRKCVRPRKESGQTEKRRQECQNCLGT